METEGKRLARFLANPCPKNPSELALLKSDRKCGGAEECEHATDKAACIAHVTRCWSAVERVNTAVMAFNKAVQKCVFGRDRVLPPDSTPLQPARPAIGTGLD